MSSLFIKFVNVQKTGSADDGARGAAEESPRSEQRPLS
jgi:hypothetical protein